MTGPASARHHSTKLSAKARNDQVWEHHKENIRNVYIDMDHTLKETMHIMETEHKLKASQRKWKEKLKSWKFEKNIPSAAMSVLVAKREKRKRELGKETQFFHGGVEIRPKRLDTFQKRRTVEGVAFPTAGTYDWELNMDIVFPTADTPPGITYCTPSPESPCIPPITVGEHDLTIRNQYSDIRNSDHGLNGDLSMLHPLSQVISSESENAADEEPQTFLPHPSNGSGERNMLIQTISPGSMLWNCPGRGLHTIDEESVIGLDDELLGPTVASDLIAEHIKGARIDRVNNRIKSSAVKYFGSILLAIERKCCSPAILLGYISEFLDLLEAGPGACVVALRELSERPTFQLSEYSDICLMYIEILNLLCQEFHDTSEVVTRMSVLLADLKSLYPEILLHTENLYNVALEGYKKMGNTDQLLQCQLSLADILIDLNRSPDAYELLGRSCGTYLHDQIGIWHDSTTTATCLHLLSRCSTLGLRPRIFRIKRILSQRPDLCSTMLAEMIAIAGIISIEASNGVLYLESLDPLWSGIFTKLSLLNNTDFAVLKAFAHLQRSNYLSNGFNLLHHRNYLDDIRSAFQYLSPGGSFLPELREDFERHYQELRSRAMNLPHLRTLDMSDVFSIARMSNTSHSASDDQSPPLLDLRTAPAGLPFVPEDKQTHEKLFEWDYLRRKYGVRFGDGRRKSLVFAD